MDGDFSCALCLDFTSDNPDTDYFVSTDCGHIFHYFCIKAAHDNGYKECPIDRKRIELDQLRKLFGVHAKPKLMTACQSFPAPSAPFQLNCTSSELKEPEYDYKFKIIMVGDSGVGKSSLLQRYADDTFSTNLFATIGCDWRTKNIQIGGKIINLSIWDTVGQEKYRSLVTNYVREAHGALMVYDITDLDSIQHMEDWSEFVRDHALPDTVRVLVGNKTDLEDCRQVEKPVGKKLATKLGNLPFFEVSAKDSYNVEAAFRLLAAKILENDALLRTIELKQKNPNISLNPRVKNQQQQDNALTQMCSTSWHWAKAGLNGTMNGVAYGWNYVTSKSERSTRRSRSRSSSNSNN